MIRLRPLILAGLALGLGLTPTLLFAQAASPEPTPVVAPQNTPAPPPAAPAAVKPQAAADPKAALPAWLSDFRLTGYIQIWARLYEGLENGLRQSQTNEKAAQEASGFSIRQARLAVEFARKSYGLRLETRFSPQVSLTDAYAWITPYAPYLVFQIGQMKVPGTYEQMQSDRELDFPTRSLITELGTDYSLSRHPNITSPFQGKRGLGRDMGVSLSGSLSLWNYLFYLGNGLGANQGIGAEEDNQEIYGNKFGAYYYATRQTLSFAKLAPDVFAAAQLPILTIGAHVAFNNHPNLIIGTDKRSVFDIKRLSTSTDLQIGISRYLTLTALYGEVRVLDDFDFDHKRDYICRGWEAKAVGMILPDTLYLAFRAEGFNGEYEENGAIDKRLQFTGNVSYRFYDKHFRVDLSYKHKRLFSKKTPDTFDDVFLLAFQAGF